MVRAATKALRDEVSSLERGIVNLVLLIEPRRSALGEAAAKVIPHLGTVT